MTRSWHQNFKRASKAKRTGFGRTHDSKSELKRHGELVALQFAKQISDLQCQVRHKLILPNGVAIKIGNRTCVYTSDFEYNENGIHVVEDHKGYQDGASKFRIAVFEAVSGQKVTIHTKG